MPVAREREVLLTGVTGFVGKVVLEALLREREALGIRRVHALVRPRGACSARERFAREVEASPCFAALPEGWARDVEVIEGDLVADGCGLDAEARQALATRVTHVLHVAASVEFDLPLAEALAANVDGSLQALELARGCARLERMVSVSTAYVTPHPGEGVPVGAELAPLPRPAEAIVEAIRAGRASEAALLAETGHPNTYTLTKCLAEHLLTARRGAVPLSLVRPSIVSAAWQHPEPGWIDSAAAFAGFVALVGAGHLRAVVADPEARLDVVPVDVVAARILEAAFRAPAADEASAPPILPAVAGLANSPSIAECRIWLTDFFARHPVDRLPAVAYVGPPGPRFAAAHWRHHELPLGAAALVSRRARRARPGLRARLRYLNRAFPYFTRRSFDFRSEGALPEGFTPRAYVETVCAGIHRHLLRRDVREVPLAGARGPDTGGDLRFARRQPEGGFWVRLAAWLVTKTLRRATELVSFDLESFREARRAAPQGARLVLVPSHRSYLDFVLCSYLCFARPDLRLGIPDVAAAVEFARIPLLGRVFRDLGAFYLRRGVGREDKELTRQVHERIRAGKTLEFFVEGARSRSRRFLPPRRGLLRCLQATGEPVVLLPVAISYDRVPEEASFLRELSGAPKAPMSLSGLLGWTLRLLRGRVQLGRVHLACGAPVALHMGREVPEVAEEVLAELQKATVATTFHLRSFLAASGLEGRVSVRALARAIRARGGRVLESRLRPEAPLPPRLERTLREAFAARFHPELRAAAGGHHAIGAYLARYDVAREPETRAADAVAAAVLPALFAPVPRDYERVAEALGEPGGAPRLDTPEALLRRDPEAHRPDVEDAFAELVARGVLVRDATRGTVRWGPRAAEIAAWRARYGRPLAGEAPDAVGAGAGRSA